MIELLDSNFHNYIETTSDLIILEFGSTFCSPCKILSNILEEIEKENNINIGKINIDVSPNLAIKYSIMSVPTMIFIKNNTVLEKISGLKDKEFIQDIVNKYRKV